jgi:hypothetical protein
MQVKPLTYLGDSRPRSSMLRRNRQGGSDSRAIRRNARGLTIHQLQCFLKFALDELRIRVWNAK